MKSRKTVANAGKTGGQPEQPRFRIRKLEERIAPWCPKINPHGKCVGWRSVKGDL